MDARIEVYRGKVWKLLLKYIPPNHQSQSIVLAKKRNDYRQYVRNYFEALKESERDENEKKIIKIISADVNRTQPECELFRNARIQGLLGRLLFIWNMRHPMSGYVQGINDIASPIIAVCLNEYIKIDFERFHEPKQLALLSDEILQDIEADTYWCLCKILENIQDYYINNQPGVSDAFAKIKELVKIVLIPIPTLLDGPRPRPRPRRQQHRPLPLRLPLGVLPPHPRVPALPRHARPRHLPR